MKILTRKTTLALSIATAIGLIGVTGCSKSAQIVSDEMTPKQAAAKVLIGRLSEQSRLKNGLRHNAEQKVLRINQNNSQAQIAIPSEPLDRENYAPVYKNTINQVIETPVSTFSIDVDTGAYTNVRRILNQGRLPRRDAVRAEEFINYFNYDYKPPQDKETPFAVHTDMVQTPWNSESYLLQLGIKAWEPPQQQRPDANLVFLLDVSGSMNSPDKLGLLKTSLTLLTGNLTSTDRISIVVYAGASGIVLEPTPGNKTAAIDMALQRLQAGGSTNGAAGIKLAYQLAEQSFIKNGINRILLATDGDFNVGTTNFDALVNLVEEKRKSGIALSTLGFGSGNYNDHLMEQLADKGNGQYSYIDSLLEARKVLVDEMNASLLTVAGDVKIQLEFNPDVVTEYRLIGYENRILEREDFNNDKVDAGEIGAGHTVTALYEVRFTDSKHFSVDPLRYRTKHRVKNNDHETLVATDELGFLKLRYKNPGDSNSQLITQALDKNRLLSKAREPSDNIKFAASVAAFAEQLGGGKYLRGFGYQQIHTLAQSSKGTDPQGIRGAFLQLVSLAELLSQQTPYQQTGGE